MQIIEPAIYAQGVPVSMIFHAEPGSHPERARHDGRRVVERIHHGEILPGSGRVWYGVRFEGGRYRHADDNAWALESELTQA